MKKLRIALAMLASIMCLWTATAACAQDGYSARYTYNYDYWVDIRESPDAYRVATMINSVSLGLETPIKAPKGIFVQGRDIYICDSGNNRLLQIRRDGDKCTLTRIIDKVAGAQPETFNLPQDVFVDEKGNIYVSDTNNNRVILMDKELKHVRSYGKPSDETFDQNLSYLPAKLCVDSAGRVFTLSKNVNKGIIKYESDGEFTGFIGANKVKYNFIDYIWKLLSTKEQRSKQEAFVPTEYENIYIDKEGFIYAVTSTFDEGELLSDQVKPIRRINAIGNDILIRNDRYWPVGDLDWTDDSDISGPSRLIDVTALDHDVYVALDRTRGRLFGYDAQGMMLWAFGGIGNSDGFFLHPVAIDHMGNDLLVLDDNECSVTVFTPTLYGSLIFEANEKYLSGDYDGSADTWREVLKLNGNYNLAFIGIGRSMIRQENYKEAMEYFAMPRDAKNYGEAFRMYRKEWVEENIGWMFILVAALLIVPLAVGKIKKIRAEVNKL